MRKVDAARQFIRKDIDILHKHLDWSTAALLREAELVLDCTDNMLARYVINDYCARNGIPWIHGGLNDCVGTVATIAPGGPCYQCIYPRGAGEDCGPQLSLAIADKVADAMVLEIARLHSEPRTRFFRISGGKAAVLDVARRKDCPTCTGAFHYLRPHDYYITYCTSAQCMSAKPVRPHSRDLGRGEEGVTNGVRYTAYANGEIHFHKAANDDVLRTVAEHVYARRFRNDR
jgi:hypothetical protein